MARLVRALGASLLLVALVAAPVAAGKPTMERIDLNDIGLVDEVLSEECGFEVLFDGTGHFILRQWTDSEGNLVMEVNNFAIRARFYTANGSVSVVDVGADFVMVLDDGSQLFRIIGNVQSIQIPGMGRVYSDVGQLKFHVTFDAEGNASFELLAAPGQHDESATEVLCAALA